MKYLLDVNAAIAWEHVGSPHHTDFHGWLTRVGRNNLHTCAMVELGFLRISMQVFGYKLTEAQAALARLKSQIGGFVEPAPSPRLSAWAATASKTSDAYLLQVAEREGLKLATFDAGIPSAEKIR